ncbi:hypothetical protein [Candidatus Magnetomonas plexicatena]|uniref:hypothetical protein n=1 Tax=Candidatus Magnetomonas plexicatena TaxID=2552947 RepID=UPI0011051BCA|nr:hypothetical protein E2O03_010210 [Nitrospirales bacterium LBB_01]
MNKLYLDIIDNCEKSPHSGRVEYKALRAVSSILYKDYATQLVLINHLLPELMQKTLDEDIDTDFNTRVIIIPPSECALYEDNEFSPLIQKYVESGFCAIGIHYCYTDKNSVLTKTFGTFYNDEIHRFKDPVFKLELGYASLLSKERYTELSKFRLEYDELTLSVSPKYKKHVEPLVTVMDFPVVTVNAYGEGYAFSFGFHSFEDPVVVELFTSILLYINKRHSVARIK